MKPFKYPSDPEKCKLIRKKITKTTFLNHNAIINTYTVIPTDLNGKQLRFGPDDNTLKDPILAALVTRGCSDLFIDEQLIAQVRGPTKFFGTEDAVDEDEPPFEGADEKDFKVFSNIRDRDDSLITQWNTVNHLRVDFWEKANGKFFICTLFILDGKPCIFGGSKNVHIPLELNVNLESLQNHLHYQMLKLVIEDVRKCDSIEPILGQQIIGEYCDGMHIVYTSTPYTVYFDENLPACFRKPIKIIQSIKSLPSEETLSSLRKISNIEGIVVYYVNTVTNEIIRRKHKTIWYVIIRCWREIIHKYTKGSISIDTITGMLKSRMKFLSDQFLHMNPEEHDHWNKTADIFIERLNNSRYNYN